MTEKRYQYFLSKLTALGNAYDELLQEFMKEQPSEMAPVRKRQNRKEGRVLNFSAMYKNKKTSRVRAAGQ